MNMPLVPTWSDIALRLALTLVAGGIIGFNRGVRGHAAGLRTTILVALAASVAMIQANILLPLEGKTAQSFGVMDLMRLPLGILTGVGFIGGGAILRRGDLVTGVTTAATLWVVTVIGLCLGGGQLVLGCVATVLTVATLWVLKRVELKVPHEQRAEIVVMGAVDGKVALEIPQLLQSHHYRARFLRQRRAADSKRAEYCFEVAWKGAEPDPPIELMEVINARYVLTLFEVSPDGK